MKITLDEIIDDKNLIGHIVLSGIGNYPAIIEKVRADGHAEFLVTINGQELDIKEFIAHWQSQIGDAIEKEAKNMIAKELGEISEITENLIGNIKENLKKKDMYIPEWWE